MAHKDEYDLITEINCRSCDKILHDPTKDDPESFFELGHDGKCKHTDDGFICMDCYDKYGTCYNCNCVLYEDVPIQCLINDEEAELVVCNSCWEDHEDDWRADRWRINDEDDCLEDCDCTSCFKKLAANENE